MVATALAGAIRPVHDGADQAFHEGLQTDRLVLAVDDLEQADHRRDRRVDLARAVRRRDGPAPRHARHRSSRATLAASPSPSSASSAASASLSAARVAHLVVGPATLGDLEITTHRPGGLSRPLGRVDRPRPASARPAPRQIRDRRPAASAASGPGEPPAGSSGKATPAALTSPRRDFVRGQDDQLDLGIDESPHGVHPAPELGRQGPARERLHASVAHQGEAGLPEELESARRSRCAWAWLRPTPIDRSGARPATGRPPRASRGSERESTAPDSRRGGCGTRGCGSRGRAGCAGRGNAVCRNVSMMFHIRFGRRHGVFHARRSDLRARGGARSRARAFRADVSRGAARSWPVAGRRGWRGPAGSRADPRGR